MKTSTVLVVDDESAIRRLLMRLLRMEGVEVLTADSVTAAERLMLFNKVDLIICDYQMPGENGLQFLHRLKSSYPRMVRVLITGYADVQVTLEAINKVRVHYCITKPFDSAETRTTISELLTWQQGQQKAAPRAFTRQREAKMAELDAEHPGIGTVRRDTQGAILLDDDLDFFKQGDPWEDDMDRAPKAAPVSRESFEDDFAKLLRS